MILPGLNEGEGGLGGEGAGLLLTGTGEVSKLHLVSLGGKSGGIGLQFLLGEGLGQSSQPMSPLREVHWEIVIQSGVLMTC